MTPRTETVIRNAFRLPSLASDHQDAIRLAMLKDAGRTDASPLRLPPSLQPPPPQRDLRVSILTLVSERPLAIATLAQRANIGHGVAERLIYALEAQGLVHQLPARRLNGRTFGITEAGLAALNGPLDVQPAQISYAAARRELVAVMLERDPDMRPRDLAAALNIGKSTASEDMRAARERVSQCPSVVSGHRTTGEAGKAPVARKTGGLVQAFLARSVE